VGSRASGPVRRPFGGPAAACRHQKFRRLRRARQTGESPESGDDPPARGAR
jgi:hypothetical protein